MQHSHLTAGALALALAFAGAAAAQPPPGGGGGGVRQICMPDFQKFCPDARPGPGGGIRECIKAHLGDFSPACQSAIAARRARMQDNGGAMTNSPQH